MTKERESYIKPPTRTRQILLPPTIVRVKHFIPPLTATVKDVTAAAEACQTFYAAVDDGHISIQIIGLNDVYGKNDFKAECTLAIDFGRLDIELRRAPRDARRTHTLRIFKNPEEVPHGLRGLDRYACPEPAKGSILVQCMT